MCNNNTNNNQNVNENNGIAEILKVIQILQQNVCPETALDSCDRPMLGGGANCLVCNTRPIMLYTCCGNGTPLSMPTSKDGTTICSSPDTSTVSADCSNVFRVEKVEDGCCTLRVLVANTDPTTQVTEPYLSTNSFFTINISCCCIIRCLNDCFVDNVCF